MKDAFFGFQGEAHAPMCTTSDARRAARLLRRSCSLADVVVIVGEHVA